MRPLDRTDQTEVALLDQIEEQHAPSGISLRQRHHQTQVGLQQVVFGPPAVLGDPLVVFEFVGVDAGLGIAETLFGE